MTAVVEAELLTKRFGEVPAVTDLSFALEAGTITGFLGPNRVLIISRGRLVLSSSLAELTARAGGAVRARCGDPQRLTKALHDRALQVTTGTDHALLVQGASSERIGEIAFAAGVPVHELVNDTGVLEDIFLELTSEAPA
jgi:ABC-2 type transport system ATP-binding protein